MGMSFCVMGCHLKGHFFGLVCLGLIIVGLQVECQDVVVIFTEDFEIATNWNTDTNEIGSDWPGILQKWFINDLYIGTDHVLDCFPLTHSPFTVPAFEGNYDNFLHIHLIKAVDEGIGGSAYFASDGGMLCQENERLLTRMNYNIDTRGYRQVEMSFWWLFGGAPGVVYGELWYSTDGGNNWNQIHGLNLYGQYDWKEEIVSIPDFDDIPSLKFGFRFVNMGGGVDPGFCIAKLQVTGIVPSTTTSSTTTTSTSSTSSSSTTTTTTESSTIEEETTSDVLSESETREGDSEGDPWWKDSTLSALVIILASVVMCLTAAGIFVTAIIYSIKRKAGRRESGMKIFDPSAQPISSQPSGSGSGYAPINAQKFADSDSWTAPVAMKTRTTSERKVINQSGLEIDFNELELDQEIGRGAFGIVYRGTWRNTDIACKQLIVATTISTNYSADAIASFVEEAYMMKNLRPHPNLTTEYPQVLTLLGIVAQEGDPFCIVTPFMPGGSANNLPPDTPNESKLRILKGIASGMYHLVSEGVVHRDLAARNVLLTEKKEPRISDFGLSRALLDDPSKNETDSGFGPLKWMSPEAILERQYSQASDVWSFGVVIFEIVTGTAPFPTLSPVQVVSKVAAGSLSLPIPEGIPVITELIFQCQQKEPQSRPAFEIICKKLKGVCIDDSGQFID